MKELNKYIENMYRWRTSDHERHKSNADKNIT